MIPHLTEVFCSDFRLKASKSTQALNKRHRLREDQQVRVDALRQQFLVVVFGLSVGTFVKTQIDIYKKKQPATSNNRSAARILPTWSSYG